jgi:hypothetical protein
MKTLLSLLFLFIPVLWIGCAGPATPFGAVNTSKNQLQIPSQTSGQIVNPNLPHGEVRISFDPPRQKWHKASAIHLKIEDDQIDFKKSDSYQIQILYNGSDVTSRFKKVAKSTHHIEYKSAPLRLVPAKNNRIEILYHRDSDKNELPYISYYEHPECIYDQWERPIAKSREFRAPASIVDNIRSTSIEKNLNPQFIAGLIAHESSFNTQAVSRSKALGLTQITALAEHHIINPQTPKPSWPRYPGINQMGPKKIRSLIWLGKINAQNEWRLDPELSIIGGSEYIHYLVTYWKNPKHQDLIAKLETINPDVFTDIILASYNAGPYRVKKQIEKFGALWLTSPLLKETRSYVGTIKSYCQHFNEI